MPRSDWARLVERFGRAVGRADFRELRESASDAADRVRTYMERTPEVPPDATAAASYKWFRPKGNLSRGELAFLFAVAFLPLLMVIVRISALPGVLSPGLSGSLLPSIGHDLNQMLSLQSVPSGDRSKVLYMLFLPTSAMLIAFTRLTFGIKVLGFRAILISVGFQESGIVPSLILIGVMVTIVVSVRPTLVRMRLPYYARVSVILSLAVLVLLGAMLTAPWMRSETLWRVAFFPVLMLGLLAEGIAKTLDSDSALTAAWRTGMTILVGMLLAGISHIPILRETYIQFPELVLPQIVAIILIAEFLDLRLFQDWDAKLSGTAMPRLFANDHALRVAVVRNRRKSGVIGRIGAPSRNGYGKRCLRRIVVGLRENGHTVKVVEGDMSLMSKLREFIPPHPTTGQPGGIVLNLSHGVQGAAPVSHVPAMLEMAGVAYTGPTPLGHMLALDQIVTARLLEQAGVQTPEARVMRTPHDEMHGLRFPLVVRPRHASRFKLQIVKDTWQLEKAFRAVSRRHQQEVVVEPYIAGREIHVALLGNAPVECLPLVETKPGKAERACPAPLAADLAQEIRAAAIAAFGACGGRDYALVNVRVSKSGEPVVLGIDSIGVLEEGGSFEFAAEAAGYGFGELIGRIIAVARERYRYDESVPSLAVVDTGDGESADHGRTSVAG